MLDAEIQLVLIFPYRLRRILLYCGIAMMVSRISSSRFPVPDIFHVTYLLYRSIPSPSISSSKGADIENPELKGLIPRITQQIFASISTADANIEYTVKVSYMEIYMERIKDLLARELIMTAGYSVQ